MGSENGTERAVRAIHIRLPMRSVCDDLVPTLKASVSCATCNLVLSEQSDRVIHCNPDLCVLVL